MTDRKLILHVGPHKTGTTAIQKTLRTTQDGLNEAGWHFETFPADPAGAHGIADQLSNSQFERALKTIQTLDDSDRNLVISSENFSRLNSEQAKYLIDNLAADDIRVVYYLRNPLDRLQSTWREWVKHGYRYSFAEFLGGRFLKPYFDPEINEMLKIEPWAKAVGADNMDLHVYGNIDNAATHFMETYFPDVALPETKSQNKVNVSPNLYKAETYRALMGYQVWMAQHPEFATEVKAVSAALEEACAETSKSYLRQIEFSLNNPIVRSIEKSILESLGARISNLNTPDQIHDKRNGSWDYVASDVWLAEPALARQVFALRDRIHAKLGAPRLDLRLRRL